MSNEQDILTIDEVADYLKVSKSKVYKDLQAGKIPGGRKIGGVWRFSRRSLEEWIASGGSNHGNES